MADQTRQMGAMEEQHPSVRLRLPTAEKAEKQDLQKDKAVMEAQAADKAVMEIPLTQEAETRRMAAEEVDAAELVRAAQAVHLAEAAEAELSEMRHIVAVQAARKEHMVGKVAIMEQQAQPELTQQI